MPDTLTPPPAIGDKIALEARLKCVLDRVDIDLIENDDYFALQNMHGHPRPPWTRELPHAIRAAWRTMNEDQRAAVVAYAKAAIEQQEDEQGDSEL